MRKLAVFGLLCCLALAAAAVGFAVRTGRSDAAGRPAVYAAPGNPAPDGAGQPGLRTPVFGSRREGKQMVCACAGMVALAGSVIAVSLFRAGRRRGSR